MKLLTQALSALIVALASGAAASTYTLTDLGQGYLPTAISPTSFIVGNHTSNGSQIAAFWVTYTSTGSIGTKNDIGTLPGRSSAGTFGSGVSEVVVSGVTNGIAVGWDQGPYTPPDVAWSFDITTWQGNHGTTPLQLNTTLTEPNWAQGINTSGFITGGNDGGPNPNNNGPEAFTVDYKGVGWTEYPGPAGNGAGQSWGYCVNLSGIVGGQAEGGSNPVKTYAAQIVSGSWTAPGSINPATAYGINDNAHYTFCGTVATGTGTFNGFYYDTSVPKYNQLGSLTINAEALGVNTSNQVVGYYAPVSGGQERAFICTSGTTMTDLNTLLKSSTTFTLNQAVAINNSGDIVGTMRDSLGNEHGFLLTP